MDFFLNIWNLLWSVFVIFLIVSYLLVLFSVVADIFRDTTTGGGKKAVWIFFLLFFPFITLLVYLFARGDGMAQRQAAAAHAARAQTEDYIRDVARLSPAAEIAKGKELLDAGAITKAEFATLKAQLLKA